jgi:8-oxo-dGTP diphosphatase
MKKVATLIYVFEDNKILLGSKKYGKAKDKLNGFGGKVEVKDKSIKESALRELKEETGLEVGRIEAHAILDMKWGEDSGAKICLFKAYELKNKAQESDEMTVSWFDKNSIPKAKMWDSDKYWFDLVLQERKFVAKLISDKSDTERLKKFSVEFVDNTEELLKHL